MEFSISSDIEDWVKETITLEPTKTVLELKNVLSSRKQIPVNLILLRLNGVVLDDTTQLSSLDDRVLYFSYNIPFIL